ncbi:MAG: hypothetical protein PHQ36_04225 [Anaerolineales bacterium]|nr:hypothetical protein [Anaerolineales bacterium]
MTKPRIDTPRGSVFIGKNGKAKLEFNTNFQRKWQGNYSAAQAFVDSEVLRLSEPFTPLLTSMLIKSGILGTDIGSGTVEWIAPYAKAQYYRPRIGTQTGALRGGFWFERMKAIHRNRIIEGARRIAGRIG